tara:strand:+ start:121 stop:357 length:237 start_codon:yes stop_codon:yes gene_type:complete
MEFMHLTLITHDRITEETAQMHHQVLTHCIKAGTRIKADLESAQVAYPLLLEKVCCRLEEAKALKRHANKCRKSPPAK